MPVKDDWTKTTKLKYRHTSGYEIQHCGHPTALFPYMICTPSGLPVIAPNHMAFSKLKQAQSAAVLLADGKLEPYSTHGGPYPIVRPKGRNEGIISNGTKLASWLIRETWELIENS